MDWLSTAGAALWNGLLPFEKSELFSDVTIRVGENSYPCHKIILSALSPYFNAMWEVSSMRFQGQAEKKSKYLQLKV